MYEGYYLNLGRVWKRGLKTVCYFAWSKVTLNERVKWRSDSVEEILGEGGVAPDVFGKLYLLIPHQKSGEWFRQKCKNMRLFLNLKVKWNPVNCPCKLCKRYIGGVGFTWMSNMEQWNNIHRVKTVWIDSECRVI